MNMAMDHYMDFHGTGQLNEILGTASFVLALKTPLEATRTVSPKEV